MSDKIRFLEAVKLAGKHGLHSHTVRRKGISGHPSERARELEAEGVAIRREREFIDGRNGVRFFYEGENHENDEACTPGVGRVQGTRDRGNPKNTGILDNHKGPQRIQAVGAGEVRQGAGNAESSSVSGNGASGVLADTACALSDPAPALFEEVQPPSAYDPWAAAA